MKKTLAVVLLLAGCAPAAAQGPALDVRCSLMGEAIYDGSCRQSFSEEDGLSVMTLTGGGQTLAIKTTASDGPWSRVLINGRPGAGFEINRTHRVFSTDDFTYQIEVDQ
jgi:hypothetical protein